MRGALSDPDLFGAVLAGESWAAWRVLLIAAMGELLTAEERGIFERLTGRPQEPGERCEEFWAIIGRRGGKTRAIAVLGAYLAALVDYSDLLAPGERASLPIMSASTWQAAKAKQYLDGIFATVPALKRLVTNSTSDLISLSTQVDIEVRPASFRTSRGGTCAAVIADEVAYWRSENTANPDAEILSSLRPSLATTAGMLIAISSPYARRGELWNAFRRDYGPTGDPAILVARAASRTMNPSLSEKVVARAYERDPTSATAEYGAEFRVDIEQFISREVVDASTIAGRFELPRLAGVHYVGFTDPSGGSADSFTAAVAHKSGDTIVLDAVRERRVPFSPEDVAKEFSDFFKTYGVTRIQGDCYSGEWAREQFRKNGVHYEKAERPKSQLYLELLPALNAGRVELLDHPRLAQQLVNLERRTSRTGRDSVDHPAGHGAHDDLINAAAGAIVMASTGAGSAGAAILRFSWT
jgi:hypothetical protein